MTTEEQSWADINRRCVEWHANRSSKLYEPQTLLLASTIVSAHGLRGPKEQLNEASHVSSYLYGMANRLIEKEKL